MLPEEKENSIFDDSFEVRRNHLELIPLWIKIFAGIFLIGGIFVPITLLLGAFGFRFTMALYGLYTFSPLTPVGLLLLAIMAMKGILAYALWTGKKWAITLGLVDAGLGLIICTFLTFASLFLGYAMLFKIRLELIALVPFLLWLIKIKPVWESNTPPVTKP